MVRESGNRASVSYCYCQQQQVTRVSTQKQTLRNGGRYFNYLRAMWDISVVKQVSSMQQKRPHFNMRDRSLK